MKWNKCRWIGRKARREENEKKAKSKQRRTHHPIECIPLGLRSLLFYWHRPHLLSSSTSYPIIVVRMTDIRVIVENLNWSNSIIVISFRIYLIRQLAQLPHCSHGFMCHIAVNGFGVVRCTGSEEGMHERTVWSGSTKRRQNAKKKDLLTTSQSTSEVKDWLKSHAINHKVI